MKLFVDDERPVPDHTWVLAQRSVDALKIMRACYIVGWPIDTLSLDHDLSTVMYEDDTTRPIMEWMVARNAWPTELYIHTANPDGEDWLVDMARQHAPKGTLRGYGCNSWGSCRVDSVERHWEPT